MHEGKIAGVYSARENAPDGAEVTEITPLCLEGSPKAENYVCMATGVWNITNSDGGKFSVEEIEIGPVWGCNAQSAIAGLFGQKFVRKGVIVSSLFLLETNKNYADGELKGLRRTAPFRGLADSVSNNGGIAPEELARDYIGEYLEEKRKQQELEEKRRVTKSALTSSRLVSLVNQEKNNIPTAERRPRCAGMSEPHKRETERLLLKFFSTEELISLAEILEDFRDAPLSEVLSELENEKNSRVLLERAVGVARIAGKNKM